MQIFISWSGARSQAVALALREWLPLILQGVTCWVSSEDIAKGTLWQTSIHDQLRDSKFALLCLTPENLESRWVLFEAGALYKGLSENMVAPVVLDLEKGDVPSPLGALQTTELKQPDMTRLVRDLAQAGSLPVTDVQITQLVSAFWDQLEGQIMAIPPIEDATKQPQRSTDDKIDEILNLVRQQPGRFNHNPGDLVTNFDGVTYVVDSKRTRAPDLDPGVWRALRTSLVEPRKGANRAHIVRDVLVEVASMQGESLREWIDNTESRLCTASFTGPFNIDEAMRRELSLLAVKAFTTVRLFGPDGIQFGVLPADAG